MTFTRRSLIKLSVAAATAGTIGMPHPAARAAEFTFKLGGELPVEHPTSIHMRKAAERITQETNGRLEVKFFPQNQLGSTTDQLSQLRSGALEMCQISGTVLSTLVPAAAIDGVGFAFKDEADAFKAMDSELGAYVREQIGKANLVVMDRIWGHGFRHVTSNRGPIRTPDDFKGLKMRVPPTQLWTSMFRTLGANPSNINFVETYSALQTKVVDAQENPLSIIDTAKFYEVQKYLSMTRHIWGGVWLLANRRSFERLPADLQATVARVLNEAAMAQRVELTAREASSRKNLADKGMVINDVNPEPFRAQLASAGFYNESKERFGPAAWSLLEKYTGKIG